MIVLINNQTFNVDITKITWTFAYLIKVKFKQVLESSVNEIKDFNTNSKNNIAENAENIVKVSLKVAEVAQRTDQISEKTGEIFSKTEETSLIVSEIKKNSDTKSSDVKNYDKEFDELRHKQQMLEESLSNTYS